MNQVRAQQIVNCFASKRIVVLGDLMLDQFIWGEVRRISPEAPVPVVEVKRESWHLGGAGNVVSNSARAWRKRLLLSVYRRRCPPARACVREFAASLADVSVGR
jgi:bifunctional ADP-heptose synthase (sugar kinase/adenylyltransferase)